MDKLIPTIIQEARTKAVLMLGYMNRKALTKTMKTGFVYFWSRRRKKLWMKGKTSGNKLKVKNIFIDCDKDAILIQTKLIGTNICHTSSKTCFYRKATKTISALKHLEGIRSTPSRWRNLIRPPG